VLAILAFCCAIADPSWSDGLSARRPVDVAVTCEAEEPPEQDEIVGGDVVRTSTPLVHDEQRVEQCIVEPPRDALLDTMRLNI